jgi:hypothetical protein
MTLTQQYGRKRNGRQTAAGTATVRPPAPLRHEAAVRTVEAGTKPAPPVVTPQAIAEAAYYLWLERGGNEVVNWLEAEATLKARAVRHD